jgi:hypothetical protein
MEVDKEIEDAMEAAGTWKGSPDRMWQHIEGEIRRRQVRSRRMRTWAPVAVAAAALVVALGVKPGSTPLPTHPSGHTVGGVANQPQPPEPIRKMPYSGDIRKPAYGQPVPLPVYLDRLNTIVLGQVVKVQDTEVPCVTPTKCDPFPAKLYTVKTTRVYKGDPGQSVQVRQLVPSERVVHPDGKSDPLMSVGSTYLFFFAPPGDGVFEEQGSRLELGADNRLMPMPHTSAVLQPIFGLSPDEAAAKLLQP